MYQAPATIWNAVAEFPLRTTWAEQMFPLPGDLLQEELQAEEDRLVAETGSKVLTAAYLTVMPLLWERMAISQYKAEAGEVASLPAVETVDDALAVAVGDFPLSETDKTRLREMLLIKPT